MICVFCNSKMIESLEQNFESDADGNGFKESNYRCPKCKSFIVTYQALDP